MYLNIFYDSFQLNVRILRKNEMKLLCSMSFNEDEGTAIQLVGKYTLYFNDLISMEEKRRRMFCE